MADVAIHCVCVCVYVYVCMCVCVRVRMKVVTSIGCVRKSCIVHHVSGCSCLLTVPVDAKRHGKLQLAIATLPAAVMGSIDPQANWKVSPT